MLNPDSVLAQQQSVLERVRRRHPLEPGRALWAARTL